MEPKKRIIHEDGTPELSFEEVFQEYTLLIHREIKRWSVTYEYDELFQIASIGIWKAYKNYDLERYATPFFAVAKKYINNELLTYHNKNKPKELLKTSRVKSVTSLHQRMTNGLGEESEVIDTVLTEDSFAEVIENRLVVREILSKLPQEQQEMLMTYLNGYTQREIAKEKGLPNSTVRYNIVSVMKKFKDCYIKEVVMDL